MKKSVNLGLLIMATGLVLAGCASLEQKTLDSWMTTKWDKEAKSTAILYFDETVQLYKVDGKANVNMYKQEAPIRGSGTVKAPKAQLIIPAGERKLVFSYNSNPSSVNLQFIPKGELPYTFVAGRFYQLAVTYNRDVINPKFTALDAAQKEAAEKATPADTAKILKEFTDQRFKLETTEASNALNVEVIDITGGKKKNSPSAVIVVKPWELQ